MATQLQKLPENTQNVLKLAACIGNQFDLTTLAIVHEKSQAETAADLWRALQESLIIPITESYKFFQDSESVEVAQGSELSVPYRFLHDRVQQAAYFLIPESQKQSTHLKIGQLLLSNIPPEEREEKIFDIVNQLNIGVELINHQTERNELACLNLMAGRKAKTSTAYTAAKRYLTVGLELLAADSWLEQYHLTLALHEEAAEAAYLCGDFIAIEQLADLVLEQARTLLDKVKVYEVKIQAAIAQGNIKEGIKIGLVVLNLLGVILPEEPNQLDIQKGLEETAALYAREKIENLIHLPEITSSEKRHRVLGDFVEAMDYYDRAIAGAQENEYINEEALAHELAAKFYLEWGKETIARAYLTNAYYAYARWGAKAKVEDLEKRYPQLLAPILNQKNSATTGETIVQTLTKTVTSSSSGSANSAILDFATVIKGSQALSGEVELDKLLSTLMQVTIENAGAEKAFLILSKAGNLVIEARGVSGTKKATVMQSIPVEQSPEIPVTLINYVYRTSETLVLDDARVENTFSADPYIIGTEPKSVLCTPIINQGQFLGILYLENNLTTRAFTTDRLEVLKILSSQAAISIENARLYQNLEDKVKERTAQLAEANQEISSLNELLKQDNLRMSAELDIVKQLQQMVLPKQSELEAIEGLEIAGFMEPADEVGGDYYDVLQQDDRVKISIGDVTGHGLESGVLMIMAQTAVRTLQKMNETDPVKFLDVINQTLYDNLQRMDSQKNMSLAILDYAGGVLKLSGQHEETIVVRADGTLECIDTMDLGFPIGLVEEIGDFITQIEVQLNPEDVVVLYTDGIPEARDINKSLYGLKRLWQVVVENRHLSAAEIREAVIDDVRQYIGVQKVFDDITLVVMKQK
ncbi:SpoIIE family protein phosphatase [Microcoleus sp. CAWBG640]|uniref:SpoIIE family protein phosphatase n=1 Tax=Microcoleus sp. CAWBG640 TaxID=2841653 RepID=UPI00312B34AF